MDCIFCKIRDRIIPKEFTYEDEEIMVFKDIHPVAPVHLLIVPKKHFRDFGEVRGVGDDALFLKVKNVIQKMIRDQKIQDKGYRLVVNGGGAQIINHLHVHLIGEIGKMVKL